MKKLKWIVFNIALLPLITGCQDKEHSIIAINTMGSGQSFIEVSVYQTRSMIDANQPFVLEVYNTTCEACKDLEPRLKSFAESSKKAVYRLNIGEVEQSVFQSQLRDAYPDIFIREYTPTIFFIKDKTLTYEVSPNKYSSTTALKSIMNKHFLSSKVTIINDSTSLETYEEKNKNYIAFAYDLDNGASLSLAADKLINAKLDNNVILLNKALMPTQFGTIKEKYNTSDDHFASSVKDGNIIKTINYLDDDGSSLNDLISTF